MLDTLVLSNNSLVDGNFAATDAPLPLTSVFDAARNVYFVAGTFQPQQYSDFANEVTVVSASSHTIVAGIEVCGPATGLAYDPGRGEIFVVCSTSQVVKVINDTSDTVVASVSFGSNQHSYESPQSAAGAAYDPATGEVFVASYYGSSVDVISDSNNSLVARIPISSGAGQTYPAGIVYDGGSKLVYVADEGLGKLWAISPSTRSIVTNVSVGGYPEGVTYDPGSGEVFVAGSAGGIAVLSDSSNAVIARIPVAGGSFALSDDPAVGAIFVSGLYAVNLSKISAASNSVVSATSLGNPAPGLTMSDGLSVDPASGVVMVDVTGEGYLQWISATNGTFLASAKFGNVPTGIAVDTGRHEVFAADNFGGGLVYVISEATDRVLATVNVGGAPIAVLYDPGRGEVFVAKSGGAVAVISDSNDSVVASIEIGGTPAGLAYDPVRGDVFVSGSQSGNISVISDSTHRVIATVPVGGGPNALAYDTGKAELFVAGVPAPGDPYAAVGVISGTNFSEVGTVGGFVEPQGVVYDAARSEVYTAGYGEPNMTVIRDSNLSTFSARGGFSGAVLASFSMAYDAVDGEILATNWGGVTIVNDSNSSVVDRLVVGWGPAAIAYDPGTGDAFVTNYFQGTVSILGIGNPSSGGGRPSTGPELSSFVANPPQITLGDSTELTAVATGAAGALDYSYTGLPPGCASADEATLRCTPDTSGQYSITATVSGSVGNSTERSVTLTVVYGSAAIGGPPSTGSSAVPTWHHLPPRWALFVAAGAGALAVIGAGIYRSRRRPDRPAHPSSDSTD